MASHDKSTSAIASEHRGSVADDPALDKAAVGMITEVQGDANFYETVTSAPLNPLSKISFQLYAILLVAALNATASGFDGVSDMIIVTHDPC